MNFSELEKCSNVHEMNTILNGYQKPSQNYLVPKTIQFISNHNESEIIKVLPQIYQVFRTAYPKDSSFDVVFSRSVRTPIKQKFGENSNIYKESKKYGLSWEEKKEVIRGQKKSLFKKLQHADVVTKDEILLFLKNGINQTEDIFKLTICLLIVSGSRPIELLKISEYKPSEKNSSLIEQTGIAKSKKRHKVIKPLIMIKSQDFIDRLSLVRDFCSDKKYGTLLNVLNLRSLKYLSHNTYTMRKIYGTLSYQLYASHKMTLPAWLSMVLGHAEDNLTTSLNYSNILVES